LYKRLKRASILSYQILINIKFYHYIIILKVSGQTIKKKLKKIKKVHLYGSFNKEPTPRPTQNMEWGIKKFQKEKKFATVVILEVVIWA
jgi:hypothetical protein